MATDAHPTEAISTTEREPDTYQYTPLGAAASRKPPMTGRHAWAEIELSGDRNRATGNLTMQVGIQHLPESPEQ